MCTTSAAALGASSSVRGIGFTDGFATGATTAGWLQHARESGYALYREDLWLRVDALRGRHGDGSGGNDHYLSGQEERVKHEEGKPLGHRCVDRDLIGSARPALQHGNHRHRRLIEAKPRRVCLLAHVERRHP
jgi:hypothetical protein